MEISRMKLGDFPSNTVYCPSGVSLARHSSSCRPLFFLPVITLPRILLPAHILHHAPLLSTLEKRIAHLLATQPYSVFRNWRSETRPYRASSWCSQCTRMSQSLPCSPRYVSLCYLIAWLLSLSLPWYSGVPSSSSAHIITHFFTFPPAVTVTPNSSIQFSALSISPICPFACHP